VPAAVCLQDLKLNSAYFIRKLSQRFGGERSYFTEFVHFGQAFFNFCFFFYSIAVILSYECLWSARFANPHGT